MAAGRPRVALLPLRELRPHEDPVPQRVVRVAGSIASLGRVERPIIVEEKTLTIIDGHHRYHALRRLGARLAPVVLASYERDIRGIGSQPRTLLVRASSPHGAVEHVAQSLREVATRGPYRVRVECCGVRVELGLSLPDAYMALKRLKARPTPAVSPEGKAYPVTIMLPPLTPTHVVRVAGMGLTLPPKSTIHSTELKRLYHPVKLESLY